LAAAAQAILLVVAVLAEGWGIKITTLLSPGTHTQFKQVDGVILVPVMVKTVFL
jgi:hypothetical protein